MRHFLSATTLALLVATSASAVPISGPAKVVDGDTLYVGNVKVRLQGIDAPERNRPADHTRQRC